MEANGRLEQTNLSSEVFHSIRIQEGVHGGQATICVGAPCLAEVLILIPGCELSTQLRKDMVKSFFGAGGQVTFESLLSNPRIQAHLRGLDNPLAEFLEDGEHKVLMRTLPRLLLPWRPGGEASGQLQVTERRAEDLVRAQISREGVTSSRSRVSALRLLTP